MRACLGVLLAALTLLAAPADGAGGGPRRFHAEVRTARVGGTTVAWYERGVGRPLLMLTGTGSTMSEWDPALVRLLAGGHRLILFDYPGVGMSGPWRGRSFDSLADVTARFAATIGARRADVLGWSMGGFVAQRLAIRHPDRVGRLILAGTNPGGSRAQLGTPRAQAIDSEPHPSTHEILSELYPPGGISEGRRFLHRLVTASRSGEIPDDFHVAAATTRRQVAAEDPWLRSDANFRELARLRVPTLATGGLADPVVPPVNLIRIASRVPGARLMLFPGAHAFLFQDRRAFSRAVAEFLRKKG